MLPEMLGGRNEFDVKKREVVDTSCFLNVSSNIKLWKRNKVFLNASWSRKNGNKELMTRYNSTENYKTGMNA